MQEFTNFELNECRRVFSTEGNIERLKKTMDKLQSEMLLDGFEETKRVYIGRNARCPCGSKRKFKKCCMNKERSK